MSSKGIRTPQLVAKDDSCSWLCACGAPFPYPIPTPTPRPVPVPAETLVFSPSLFHPELEECIAAGLVADVRDLRLGTGDVAERRW